ncbi:MAG: PfkB family carbohydrate kinase [Planctomycetes bacterium]|nr:PfkB family carbohydrate kinase [Planctomycetota bacterium]
MPLLVTGSIGIDTIRTPHGSSENCIGGSAIYFTMAASFFAPVRFIGVVGADCPFDIANVFAGRDVDLRGLEIRTQSKTFRWTGTYKETMDDRTTDAIELNVLAEQPPVVPKAFADSRFVFLANTAPRLQIQLLSQIPAPVFVAADTMDLWITNHLPDLRELLTKVHCLIINADEAKLLARQFNLVRAAEQILTMGPSIVIVKKGESGSLMCLADGNKFVLPAYPATEVRDPTGAGDSFAGGLMGYLAEVDRTDFDTLKTAVAYGTVVASFTIADFSLSGLTSVTRRDIDIRLEMLRRFTCF